MGLGPYVTQDTVEKDDLRVYLPAAHADSYRLQDPPFNDTVLSHVGCNYNRSLTARPGFERNVLQVQVMEAAVN